LGLSLAAVTILAVSVLSAPATTGATAPSRIPVLGDLRPRTPLAPESTITAPPLPGRCGEGSAPMDAASVADARLANAASMAYSVWCANPTLVEGFDSGIWIVVRPNEFTDPDLILQELGAENSASQMGFVNGALALELAPFAGASGAVAGSVLFFDDGDFVAVYGHGWTPLSDILAVARSVLLPPSPSPIARLHPRGGFDWCPIIRGTEPLPRRDAGGADAAALRFDRALLSNDHPAIDALIDPTIARHTNRVIPDPQRAVRDPRRWFKTATTNGLRVTTYAKARGFGPTGRATNDPLVRYGCGSAVAGRTWQVAVKDDSATSSSRVLFFLVHRPGGWRVWGSY
jgi:hypothetical protein